MCMRAYEGVFLYVHVSGYIYIYIYIYIYMCVCVCVCVYNTYSCIYQYNFISLFFTLFLSL